MNLRRLTDPNHLTEGSIPDMTLDDIAIRLTGRLANGRFVPGRRPAQRVPATRAAFAQRAPVAAPEAHKVSPWVRDAQRNALTVGKARGSGRTFDERAAEPFEQWDDEATR